MGNQGIPLGELCGDTVGFGAGMCDLYGTQVTVSLWDVGVTSLW